jgi:hypothetical protein
VGAARVPPPGESPSAAPSSPEGLSESSIPAPLLRSTS